MILYLHGLESSPNGAKARYLKSNFDATAVDLDTSAAIACRNAAMARGQSWSSTSPAIDAAFKMPMSRARAALAEETRLVVGSSFGGAVLMNLVAEGSWRGPSLFICPAAMKLTPHRALPPGVPAVILHGRRDDIVPLADSRALAAGAGGPGVMLWEIDDGHRMTSILTSGVLSMAVNWLLSPQALQRAQSEDTR